MNERSADGAITSIEGVHIPANLWGCRAPLLAVRWYLIDRASQPYADLLVHVEAVLEILSAEIDKETLEGLRDSAKAEEY